MASATWWSKDVVAVVTGSNKGIGLEIVRQLAEKGLTVVLTARNEKRGLAAIELLKSQGLDVYFHPLDVSSTSSVSELASWLKRQFNGVDILINNAGVVNYKPEFIASWLKRRSNGVDSLINNAGVVNKADSETPTEDYESVKVVIETNYEGVKRVTKALLPIMKTSYAGSRIINVSSSFGKLQYLKNASLQEEVSIEHLTQEKLDAFVQRFLEDVKAGVVEENGWPSEFSAYIVSKVALNAYTRLLAKSLENLPDGQKVYVNCLCPGSVKTDMSNNTGEFTIEEGADTPVWLALLPPPEVPTGQYFKQRQSMQF